MKPGACIFVFVKYGFFKKMKKKTLDNLPWVAQPVLPFA